MLELGEEAMVGGIEVVSKDFSPANDILLANVFSSNRIDFDGDYKWE